MFSRNVFGSLVRVTKCIAGLAVVALLGGAALAQTSASITGTVKDTTQAVVQGATVTIRDIESGLTRTAETDSNGSYSVPSLAVGQYEVKAEKAGFKQALRQGLTLVVAQQAVVNLTLELGDMAQRVTVTAEVPLVNTTTSSTSGLVSEEEVKDLPLNGRSFDQLLTLNVGTVNYSSQTTFSGNLFSIDGKRPEENRFLVNGVDYVGTNSASGQITPGGISGQLLGVDGVREFNVVQHTYGAEYGKRAGGQVSIVTQSGTNQLHGTAFEFLRNSVLDAKNYFDHPTVGRIPPFKRNQFGAALGGPIKKDKVFLFGNYEGFRQRLGISDVPVVPDVLARQGFLPIGPNNSEILTPKLVPGMLPFFSLWPIPNGPELGGGLALDYANPVQKIREDFGLARFDYALSAKDTFSANYLIDDGENDTPQADPLFTKKAVERSQVLGFQETRVFTPSVVNVASFGFSRVWVISQVPPVTAVPPTLSLISGEGPGTISIGGGNATGVASSVTSANGQGQTWTARNYFTWSDDVHVSKGKHTLSAGGWIQRVQQNVSGGTPPLIAGTVSFSTLTAFLQDAPTQFQGIPAVTPLGFRSTEAAWYVQDEIKLKPNFTLRLGLRDEMTNGLNEAHCRSAVSLYDANGIIETNPLIGCSALTQNNAKALWQPRIGLSWDPTGKGTWAIRAGFGIYVDLQDNLASRLDANYPFDGTVASTAPLLSIIPFPGGTEPAPPCNAQLQAANQPCSIFAPQGAQPNFHTPTVQDWSLTVERGITKSIVLQLGYVGSESYHNPFTLDTNVARPVVCTNPAGCTSGGIRAATQTGHVPQGTLYEPSTPGLRPNPYVANTLTYFFYNNSSYHGGNVSLLDRASRGLTFKANYTFSKALDLQSAAGSVGGANEPAAILNPYDLNQQKGVAAFDVEHQFNASFSYQLPFGEGQHWGGGSKGLVNRLIGDWQWNGILTVQSGLPFTPQAGSNISGTGDTSNPDVASLNPSFSGPIILGTVSHWFNPSAFVLPTAGTFGNVSRGEFFGPGLTDLDTSLFKKIIINERLNLQFRAEAFNILNHSNFGLPNPVVFSGAAVSPSAGVITSTITTSRQLQFALKLNF